MCFQNKSVECLLKEDERTAEILAGYSSPLQEALGGNRGNRWREYTCTVGVPFLWVLVGVYGFSRRTAFKDPDGVF